MKKITILTSGLLILTSCSLNNNPSQDVNTNTQTVPVTESAPAV